MSGATITENFKAQLETLIGHRGPKTKNAVLWSEIEKIYAEARRQAAGAATLPANINAIISDAIGSTVTDAVNSAISELNQSISDLETDVSQVNSSLSTIETAQDQLAQSSAALTSYVDQTFLDLQQDITGLTGSLTDAESKLISVETAAIHGGVLSDQYLPNGSSYWTSGGTAAASVLVQSDNELYSVGLTWRFTLGATDAKYLITTSTRALWAGQATATAFVVEVEFDLESGSLGGAGVRLIWYNASSTGWTAAKSLSAMVSNPPASGRMIARAVFQRPSAFTGTFASVSAVVDANYLNDTTYGARAAKTISIHRVSIRVATEEEIGSGVVGAQISASISAHDLTVISREQAIANSVTALAASMSTELAQKADASAVTSLTTRVTDAEGEIDTIAGQITAISSDITNLGSQTSANATAVSGLATRVTNAEGSISTLATQQTTLSSSIDALAPSVQGYQVALDQVSDVTQGAAVTVSLAAAAVGLPNTVHVAEGSVARVTSGQTNGASVKIPAATSILFGGQRIKISVLALRPLSNAATSFGIAYSAGSDGNSGFMQADSDTSTTAKWFSFYYTVPMPSAAGDHYIGLFGDISKSGKATRFARVSVEIAAVAGEVPDIQTLNAAVSNILAVSTDDLAGTALGQLMTQLEVDAAGNSAIVSEQGTAIADLEGKAAASLVWRVGAGGAAAGLELVAADNPVLGQASALRAAADNIILAGTVTTKHMVMTDTTNLIPNPDFLFGASEWYRDRGTITYLTGENDAPIPTVVQLTRTTTECSLTSHANFSTTADTIYGIPCAAGDKFHVEAWVKASVANSAWPFHLVQFSVAAGTSSVVNPAGSAPALAAGTWTKVTGVVTATASGRMFLRLWNSVNNSSQKYTKIRLIKQGGAELQVDGAITAEKVNTASFGVAGLSLFGGNLQSTNFNAGAGTGWQITQSGSLTIPDANVTTLKIAGRSVIIPEYQTVTGTVWGGIVAMQEIQWLNITLPYAGAVIVMWSGSQVYNGNYAEDYMYQIRVNGSAVTARGGAVGINVMPNVIWSGELAAGTHRIGIWFQSAANIGVQDRTLIIWGAMR